MFELEANEDQLDFPCVYGSAKNGWIVLGKNQLIISFLN